MRGCMWLTVIPLVIALSMATFTAVNPTNLTPHDINVVKDGKTVVTFERSGKVARLVEDPATWEDAVEVVGVEGKVAMRAPYVYGGVDGMPKEEYTSRGVIVSELVARKLAEMGVSYPVFSPDMGALGAVRDGSGRIVGTQKLILWNKAVLGGK